jgi:hypothetical protein
MEDKKSIVKVLEDMVLPLLLDSPDETKTKEIIKELQSIPPDFKDPITAWLHTIKELIEIIDDLKTDLGDEVFSTIISKAQEKVKSTEIEIQKEFKETFDTVKHIFISKSLILPKNWEQVFHWYFFESGNDISKIKLKDWVYLFSNKEIYEQWAKAKAYGFLENQSEKTNKEDKGESLAVRYSILNDFFTESSQFRDLSEKHKEETLAYILATIPRTAKGIKNGESKYISKNHKDRADELINKIKKGEIL